MLLDVQANLAETSPFFVYLNGFGEHLFSNIDSILGMYNFGCLSDLLFQQATTLQARSKDGGGLGTRFHFILKLTRTKLARAPQPIAARPPKILDDRK